MTAAGLFGNPVLGKKWTEHMLGCFEPTRFIHEFSHFLGFYTQFQGCILTVLG